MSKSQPRQADSPRVTPHRWVNSTTHARRRHETSAESHSYRGRGEKEGKKAKRQWERKRGKNSGSREGLSTQDLTISESSSTLRTTSPTPYEHKHIVLRVTWQRSQPRASTLRNCSAASSGPTRIQYTYKPPEHQGHTHIFFLPEKFAKTQPVTENLASALLSLSFGMVLLPSSGHACLGVISESLHHSDTDEGFWSSR